MMCMSVDLPEPDGPMIAVNSPRRMPRVTSSQGVDAVVRGAVALAEVLDPGDEARVGVTVFEVDGDVHVIDATEGAAERASGARSLPHPSYG